MAYGYVFATEILEEASYKLADSLKYTYGLLGVVQKVQVDDRTQTAQVVVPGSITGATRTVGSAYSNAGTMPTDSAVTLQPATEYSAPLPIDRIYSADSRLDLLREYMPLMVDNVAAQVNTALWNLYSSVTTNSVGEATDPVSADLAHQAWTKLFNARAPMSDIYLVVGGEEMQVIKPALTWSVAGPSGEAAVIQGSVPMLGGFKVVADQQRKTSGSVAYNLALTPTSLACAFKTRNPESPGTKLSQFTHPKTNITLFLEERAMNESTNGVGTAFNLFCTAVCDDIYQAHACIVTGSYNS